MLSIALSLTLVASMCPATALATDDAKSPSNNERGHRGNICERQNKRVKR